MDLFYFHIVDDIIYWDALQYVVECALSLDTVGSVLRGEVVEILVKMSLQRAQVKIRIIRVNWGFRGAWVQIGDACGQ